MEEKDLILTAYRGDKKTKTINIDLKAHTYGYELYRISLMLLDKIIKMNGNKELTSKKVEDFFTQMGKDYLKFYIGENNE